MKKRKPGPIVRLGRIGYRIFSKAREQILAREFTRKMQSSDWGNDFIAESINSGKKCMISRLGFSEIGALLNYEEIRMHASGGGLGKAHALLKGSRAGWDEKTLRTIHLNAGVFPSDPPVVEEFCRLFLERFSQTDLLAAFRIPGESYLRLLCCPESKVAPLSSLEPFRHINPWSQQLANKKVLVIHPFVSSIREQYQKRDLLFRDPRVLPKFDLKTLRAVQSIAGNPCGFYSWFDALRWMEVEMEKTDFDVCLVGAGAYGLPLAAHAKKLGKIAIHMGGALQLLFGIKGGRWEHHVTDISRLFNEHWIRPDESERPHGLETIESGCYW